MLKQKSNTLAKFKEFKALAENKLNTTIKAIQSYNGGEFLAFKYFLDESGIEKRFSCPYTSEQIGLVEGSNRSIVET